jgi:hypothetical protein
MEKTVQEDVHEIAEGQFEEDDFDLEAYLKFRDQELFQEQQNQMSD